jgi:hypothetical protein
MEEAYNFEELAFHLIFPTFGFHFVGDAENLVNRTGNHPQIFFALEMKFMRTCIGTLEHRKHVLDCPPW